MSRRAIVIVALSAGAALAAGRGWAQWHSPYSDFQSLSLADMDSVRVKLTWGGIQGARVPTLVIVKSGAPFKVAAFMPFRRPGFEYARDDSPVGIAGASARELEAIIAGVGKLPAVTGGGVSPNGTVSFALLSRVGGKPQVFEAIVNDTTGRDLLATLLAALENNDAAARKVRAFGCGAAMLPGEAPPEVGDQVTVRLGSVIRDPNVWKRFTGKVRITNHSSATLAGPLTLVVVRPSGDLRLLGEDGFTCAIQPRGLPFLDVSVGSGLAPGATVERGIHFLNPSLERPVLEFRIYAGAGTR